MNNLLKIFVYVCFKTNASGENDTYMLNVSHCCYNIPCFKNVISLKYTTLTFIDTKKIDLTT